MIESISAQILIYGAILGGLYTLLAVGFALVNGVARIFNLAHGTLYVLCAYFIYSFIEFGTGLHLAIVLSLILTIITGILMYQFFIHPLRKKGFPAIATTLALATFIQALIGLIWTAQYISIPPLVSGYSVILGQRVGNERILIFVVAVILVALIGLFISRTRVGKSIQAVAQNIDVARLVGINIKNTFMISMGLSALLAGFAAVLFVPAYSMNPAEWTTLFRIFPVLVLGGLGSIKGALAGSFIIAYIEKMVEYTIGSAELGQSVTFAIMLMIILIRPQGIFGKKRNS